MARAVVIAAGWTVASGVLAVAEDVAAEDPDHDGTGADHDNEDAEAAVAVLTAADAPPDGRTRCAVQIDVPAAMVRAHQPPPARP
jgi:hypothetical protein